MGTSGPLERVRIPIQGSNQGFKIPDRWEAGDKKKTKSDYFPRHTCAVKGLGRAISASRPNASCKLVDWDSGSILTTVIDLFLDVPVEITENHQYRLFIWLTSRLYTNCFTYSHCHETSISALFGLIQAEKFWERGWLPRFDCGEHNMLVVFAPQLVPRVLSFPPKNEVITGSFQAYCDRTIKARLRTCKTHIHTHKQKKEFFFLIV